MKLLLIKHQSPQYKPLWDITHLPLNEWYEVESESQSKSQSTESLLITTLKRHLTHYEMDIPNEIFYTIKTTYGSIGWIPESFFLTQEEWRSQRLKLLLK